VYGVELEKKILYILETIDEEGNSPNVNYDPYICLTSSRHQGKGNIVCVTMNPKIWCYGGYYFDPTSWGEEIMVDKLGLQNYPMPS